MGDEHVMGQTMRFQHAAGGWVSVCWILRQLIVLLLLTKSASLEQSDMNSMSMPKEHQCDACTAIAYQLRTALEAANKVLSKLDTGDKRARQAAAARFTDALENGCDRSNYEDYGFKDVGGKKTLHGEGINNLASSSVSPSEGRKWVQVRLEAMCKHRIEEVGEDELMEFWRAGTLTKSLCDKTCKGSQETGEGTRKRRKGRKRRGHEGQSQEL